MPSGRAKEKIWTFLSTSSKNVSFFSAPRIVRLLRVFAVLAIAPLSPLQPFQYHSLSGLT